jgi:hypothetical protein
LIRFVFVFKAPGLGEKLAHATLDRNFGAQGMSMSSGFMIKARIVRLAAAILLASASASFAFASSESQNDSPKHDDCRVEAVDYKGWHAQQVSNRWVQLVVVPQNGGRLIQVTFAGHPYLFVNPKFAGKYLPPASGQWFNYGGDKLWLLPEGNDDEQHWAGDSDIIDDGPFTLRKVSEGKTCEIELTGPADPQTGIQFVRNISLDADSSRIRFHALMKNISGHSLDWSMQSVSQYDTSAGGAQGVEAGALSGPAHFNQEFWTFTPANPSSSYLNRYYVRFGPAQNPAVRVREDGLFTVHYVHMAAELWLDSKEGWLAVVDGATRYAMVERFRYDENATYPGKASVIFWTNGPEIRLSSDGIASLSSDPDAGPYYLEAEINSPMCHLRPGESCTLETEWFPTRAGADFRKATEAGVVMRPLQATNSGDGKIKLSGSFGVFYSGRLVARLYDEHGRSVGTMPVVNVSPSEPVSLDSELSPKSKAPRVSLHLQDESGVDRGSLGEVRVDEGDKR